MSFPTSSDDRARAVWLFEHLDGVGDLPSLLLPAPASCPRIGAERPTDVEFSVVPGPPDMVEHRAVQSLLLVARVDGRIPAVSKQAIPAFHANPADDPDEHRNDPAVHLGDPLLSPRSRITPHLPTEVLDRGRGDLELRPPVKDPEQKLH